MLQLKHYTSIKGIALSSQFSNDNGSVCCVLTTLSPSQEHVWPCQHWGSHTTKRLSENGSKKKKSHKQHSCREPVPALKSYGNVILIWSESKIRGSNLYEPEGYARDTFTLHPIFRLISHQPLPATKRWDTNPDRPCLCHYGNKLLSYLFQHWGSALHDPLASCRFSLCTGFCNTLVNNWKILLSGTLRLTNFLFVLCNQQHTSTLYIKH